MLIHTLYISKYDWLVHCYFAVDTYYADTIVNRLDSLGASTTIQRETYRLLSSGALDSGITYSNYHRRESVLVTAITSNASEFFNSFVHESGHLATHIAIADDLDLKGEEVRYIQGDVARALFPSCRHLLCDCCRKQKR